MYILLTYLCSFCCCCCYFVSFVVLFDFCSSHLCCLSSQLKVVRWGRFARAEAQRREKNNIQSRFKIKKCGKRNTQNTNSISIDNLCVFFWWALKCFKTQLRSQVSCVPVAVVWPELNSPHDATRWSSGAVSVRQRKSTAHKRHRSWLAALRVSIDRHLRAWDQWYINHLCVMCGCWCCCCGTYFGVYYAFIMMSIRNLWE